MKHIILIGLPNCGKSTLGPLVAESLDMPFTDTDRMLIKDLPPAARFPFLGWAAKASEKQWEVVESLQQLEVPTIIATGAELPLEEERRKILKKIGVIIFLDRDTEVIINTIRDSIKNRKMAAFVNVESGVSMNEICVKEYADCVPEYRDFADIIIDNNGTVEEGLASLISVIRDLPPDTFTSMVGNKQAAN